MLWGAPGLAYKHTTDMYMLCDLRHRLVCTHAYMVWLVGIQFPFVVGSVMMRLSSVNPQSQQALLSIHPLRSPDKLLTLIAAIVLDLLRCLMPSACDEDDCA